MRKFAITLTAASMIMGGLAGCGVDNQTRDMGGAGHQNLGYHTAEQGGAFTGARYTGEGPLTDMMTPDARHARDRGRGFGQTGAAGFGRDGAMGARGATGIGADRGQLGVQDRIGPTGRTNRGGANAGVTSPLMDGQAAGYHARPNERMGIRGFGTDVNQRGAGTRGATGVGANRPGMGNSGLVGDRPGMVDDRGILREQRGERGTGVLGGDRTRQGTNALTGNRGQKGAGTGALTGDRTQRGAGTMTARYHSDYDGQTVQRIQQRVEGIDNVRDGRVIIHDNTVVVGVETTGRENQAVEKEVRKQVQGMADGRDVHVVTDQDAVTRIRTMDDRLRGGAAFEEIGATFTEMLGDLGRAAQRPFERSR
ncbi:YhcN/YlaJ family sporulation lipoprotein [Bacillus sp. FJAT-45350]|uniref:YhcN/YlaJ family sporulation lipoprotein n=1 Tax=Bacillus sp. FJAT-45350 TaxID=2011014 RepID=UPI000BB8D4E0|nr:YhcN/YlaJ family sporulation lipoprotein [Bacillus sp. FJAT-45350]